MYESFFGFNEKPFKLVPNPAYLFLSRSHEEALAHLTYASRQGDGFVAVIGEVGTGKTILCRSFLESLDKQTEAAFIFNPKLDAVRLLKAINDEFAIDSDMDNPKDLIDVLNAFLLEQKSNGKTVILLIDEAQNLNRDVLEQLRLISNLETTSDKLIQIILVGQPELLKMLESHELRQLGQRIALRSHLDPLAYHETQAYIRHRILVASGKSGVRFSPGAFRRIHKFSGGIPRLINIVCDRTLLIAFGLNRLNISSGMVKAAVRELSTGGRRTGQARAGRMGIAGGLIGILCVGLFLLWPGVIHRDAGESPAIDPTVSARSIPAGEKTETVAAKEVVDSEKAETGPPEKPVGKRIDFSHFLNSLSPTESRKGAIQSVLELWGTLSGIDPHLDETEDNLSYFTLAARQNGLAVERLVGGLDRIRRLNLPVVLEFPQSNGTGSLYLAVIGMDKSSQDLLMLTTGSDSIQVTPETLMRHWPGVSYLPWKNFLNLSGNIPLDHPKDAVTTLKLLLRDIGFTSISLDGVYDLATREAVEAVQRKHRLLVDGVVGSHTKIALYKEWKKFDIPHLSKDLPDLNPAAQINR